MDQWYEQNRSRLERPFVSRADKTYGTRETSTLVRDLISFFPQHILSTMNLKNNTENCQNAELIFHSIRLD